MPGVIHRPEVRPATSRIIKRNTTASSRATSGVPTHPTAASSVSSRGPDPKCEVYSQSVSEDALALRPANLTFEQAAAVGVSVFTALQALRDHGKVQPGQKVLITGASGGVGTFAVQIAKAFGAEVTGVCSTRNVDIVRSIGADHVIDYTQEDFTQSEQRYDLILDNVGNPSLADTRAALTPEGTLLANGAPVGGWVGGLGRPAAALALSLIVSQQGRPFVSLPTKDDLATLKDLAETGKITPVIDRTYPLGQTPEAVAYVGEGHAQGKPSSPWTRTRNDSPVSQQQIGKTLASMGLEVCEV